MPSDDVLERLEKWSRKMQGLLETGPVPDPYELSDDMIEGVSAAIGAEKEIRRLREQVESVSTWLCDWDEDVPQEDVAALAEKVCGLMKERRDRLMEMREREALWRELFEIVFKERPVFQLSPEDDARIAKRAAELRRALEVNDAE